MTAGQLLVVVVVTVAGGFAVARSVPPPERRSILSLAACAVAALPFALLLGGALAPAGSRAPADRRSVGVPAVVDVRRGVEVRRGAKRPTACTVIRVAQRDSVGRPGYAVRPSACGSTGDGGATFRLHRAAIRSSDGDELHIVAGAVKGYVDRSEVSDDVAHVAGWAANLTKGRAASRVLVFVDDLFIVAVKPTMERLDVGRANDVTLRTPGFSIALPIGALPNAADQPAKLRLFGVDRGTASEIPMGCSAAPDRFGCSRRR